MVEIRNDLNKIKEYLYEAHLEVTMHTDFDHLVKLKSVNDELRETLILLHSNYKAEFQAIKNHNFRVLLNIVDTQANSFDKVIHKQDELSKILEDMIKAKSGKKISIGKVIGLLASITTFIVIVFYLFTSDKEAGKMVIDLVKSLIPNIM